MTLLIVLLGLAPLSPIATSWSVIAVIAGVQLAYYGYRETHAVRFFIALLCVELVYGMDLGIISLPYLVTAMLLMGISRRTSIAPLDREEGWFLSVIIRSVLVASCLAVIMSLMSTGVGALVYRYDQAFVRFSAQYYSVSSIVGMIVATGILLIVLRRIKVPFRGHVVYGI